VPVCIKGFCDIQEYSSGRQVIVNIYGNVR